LKSNAAHFWCSNNMSISRDYVCDLHKDCPEGEDEEQDCGKCRANFKLSLSILRVQQVKTFMPKQVMKVQRGVKIYFYSFFSLGASWGWVVNATPWQLYPLERDLVPLLQEVGWASGPAYDGCGKSHPPPEFEPRAFHPIASPDTDSKI